MNVRARCRFDYRLGQSLPQSLTVTVGLRLRSMRCRETLALPCLRAFGFGSRFTPAFSSPW